MKKRNGHRLGDRTKPSESQSERNGKANRRGRHIKCREFPTKYHSNFVDYQCTCRMEGKPHELKNINEYLCVPVLDFGFA